MATVKHRFVNPKVDSGDATIARPSAWNDDHVLSDGTTLAVRRGLIADTTFYVATTGDDVTGDGSVSLPWKTPQHAWNWIQANVDSAGFGVTIKLADGTYSNGGSTIVDIGGGTVSLDFLGNHANPGNVVFDITGTYGFFINGFVGGIGIDGIKFSGPTTKNAIKNQSPGARVVFYQANLEFGNMIGGTGVHAYMGEVLSYQSTILISGSMATMYVSEGSGNCDIEQTVHTLTGTPAFSTAFAHASEGSACLFWGSTFSGAATGKRFLGECAGSFRGGLSTLTTLPGNAAGELLGSSTYTINTNTNIFGAPFTELEKEGGDYFSQDFWTNPGFRYELHELGSIYVSAGFQKDIHIKGGSALGTHKFRVNNATGGSEDCSWSWGAAIAGTKTDLMSIGAGLQLGSPTGGDKGLGTLNAAGDIYKNNGAYTNPDYALESYFHGGIERYKDNEGAAEYQGLVALDDLHQRLESDLRLPGIHDEPMGAFERTDKILEKLEEAFIYITQLHERIAKLESK
jgi:hypothetical protein